MKIGKRLPMVLQLLRDMDISEYCALASRIGLPGETLCEDLAALPDDTALGLSVDYVDSPHSTEEAPPMKVYFHRRRSRRAGSHHRAGRGNPQARAAGDVCRLARAAGGAALLQARTRKSSTRRSSTWSSRRRATGGRRRSIVDVARVHSGDPAIYGATAEQMRRLEKLGIPYEVVPGVSSFTAAAASLSSELTKPGVSQTVILTRVSGRASPVPEKEALAELGEVRGDAVHLSVRPASAANCDGAAAALSAGYAGRVGAPGELA